MIAQFSKTNDKQPRLGIARGDHLVDLTLAAPSLPRQMETFLALGEPGLKKTPHGSSYTGLFISLCCKPATLRCYWAFASNSMTRLTVTGSWRHAKPTNAATNWTSTKLCLMR